MEVANELKYILYLFWMLGGICVVIFFIRKKNYKEPDISEYYRIANELNEMQEYDLELINKRNKEIDKIEKEILKCKEILNINKFSKKDN